MPSVQTKHAAIAQYWLGTEVGRERYPENPALIDFGEPHCFACGDPANWPGGKLWTLWNRSGLQRCHLVPRMLGGADRPDNLVLLCAECHWDAPDVSEPAYMLEWMGARESRHVRAQAVLKDMIGRAGLDEVFEELADNHH